MAQVHDISYGFVPVHITPEGMEFLVVRNRRNRHYFFPKGHKKKYETSVEAAVRELWEESGCVPIAVWSGETWSHHVDAATVVYREQYLYTKRDGRVTDKICVYYLAQVEVRGDIQDKGEISEIRWMPVSEDSASVFTFETKRSEFLSQVLPCLRRASLE